MVPPNSDGVGEQMTGFHDNNIEHTRKWGGRSDRRGGGWVGIREGEFRDQEE